MNLDDLYTLIYNEINNNLCILENNNNLQIDIKNLNKILLILFNISSKNEYSFSINREEYDKCIISIFDKKNSDIKTIILELQRDNNSASYKINSNFYKLKNSILKIITIIPIIGPDGVGKTTLLTTILNSLNQKFMIKRFKKIVRRSIIYNILYPINRAILRKKLGKKPEKDQHDDKHHKLIILVALLYYPYLIAISLISKKLIFIDRFFNDSLLKNISFMDKTTTIRENWQLLLKFIPRTFWIIHLDAKSEIILTRKDELSSDDIDKYRELNFKIYLEKPAVVYSYINTGNNLDNCKNNIFYIGKKINLLK